MKGLWRRGANDLKEMIKEFCSKSEAFWEGYIPCSVTSLIISMNMSHFIGPSHTPKQKV